MRKHYPSGYAGPCEGGRQHPDELATVEWRDLERLLREVFEGIGFHVILTRPSKDGGFDLELTATERGQKQVYLVEVKHWSEQKPGTVHVRKLIKVTASRKATAHANPSWRARKNHFPVPDLLSSELRTLGRSHEF